NIKSDMLPSLDLNATVTTTGSGDSKEKWSYAVTPTISWDIDIFGKLRNLSRAAMNNYLASTWGARAVELSLTAEVATTYFALLAYSKNYHIALQTFILRDQSLTMIDSMYHYGAVSLVDLEQARSSTQQAEAATYNYKNAVIKTSISLNTLLGRNHREIEIGDIYKITHNIEIPTGMPSQLLERRPDIMQSFYNYNSAISQMKAAKAARFPSLALNGSGGLISDFATSLASGKPLAWSATISLLQPILNWRTNLNNMSIAKDEMKSALLGYEQSVINAVGEVEKALSAIENGKKELNISSRIVNSTTISQNLTRELYAKGMSAYLDVLDADRSLLTSQTDYITTLENLLNSYVLLFKALGGRFN
ncbi:MAG: TolC family protein, partial [Rikenellaceae bacterium]